MPELPEVQTVVNDLIEAGLKGALIQRVKVGWPRSIAGMSPHAFARSLVGLRIDGIHRRAKYIIFTLGPGKAVLLMHLRMSGRLDLAPAEENLKKHEHVCIAFADGRELRLHDTRKFARLYLCKKAADIIGDLGPEPLGPDFRLKTFRTMLKKRSRMLKPLLLDQHFIAGLGNIYVDEALFEAGLHPCRRACTLTPEESGKLFKQSHAFSNAACATWAQPSERARPISSQLPAAAETTARSCAYSEEPACPAPAAENPLCALSWASAAPISALFASLTAANYQLVRLLYNAALVKTKRHIIHAGIEANVFAHTVYHLNLVQRNDKGLLKKIGVQFFKIRAETVHTVSSQRRAVEFVYGRIFLSIGADIKQASGMQKNRIKMRTGAKKAGPSADEHHVEIIGDRLTLKPGFNHLLHQLLAGKADHLKCNTCACKLFFQCHGNSMRRLVNAGKHAQHNTLRVSGLFNQGPGFFYILIDIAAAADNGPTRPGG